MYNQSETAIFNNEEQPPQVEDAYAGYDDVATGTTEAPGLSAEIVYHPYFQLATFCLIMGVIGVVAVPISGWFIGDGLYRSYSGPSHLLDVVVCLLVGLFLMALTLMIVGFILAVLATQWNYIHEGTSKEQYGAGEGMTSTPVYDQKTIVQKRRTFIISVIFTVPYSIIGFYYCIAGLVAVISTASSNFPTFTNFVDYTGFGLGFLMLYFGCALISLTVMISVGLFRSWKQAETSDPGCSHPILQKIGDFLKRYVCCVNGQVAEA